MQTLPFAVRPEDAGVSSAGILNYLDALADAGIEHHAIWVLRHGQVACRMNFAPYDDQTPHMLFSLSKSFCSCAAGFAVQEGLLSWETRLIDVLPEKFPEAPSAWLQGITLHHLLTMGSGLHPDSDHVDGEDWPSLILACGCDHEPGTHFHYNSHGTYLVSAMVQKVTGMSVRDYLIPRLFVPLGMMNADGAAPQWDSCPGGISVGGWGLWLSCAQIARFGQCLLQKGRWDGVQVLPAQWLERAASAQIDNANGGPRDHEWGRGYGYQFWMCQEDRYRGDGMFAQLCIIDEKADMAVCCVSGVPDIGKALELIHGHLFPAADLPPADESVQQALQDRLAALAYPGPAHDGCVPVSGSYRHENTALEIDKDQVRLSTGDGQVFSAPYGEAVICGDVQLAAGFHQGVMTMQMRFLKGPFTMKVTAAFSGDQADMTLEGIGQEKQTGILRKA